jgi:hypothetical protein
MRRGDRWLEPSSDRRRWRLEISSGAEIRQARLVVDVDRHGTARHQVVVGDPGVSRRETSVSRASSLRPPTARPLALLESTLQMAQTEQL